MRFFWGLVLCSMALSLKAGDEHHQDSISLPRISLVLSQGDREELVETLFAYWAHTGRCVFPSILATEPGPIDLARGLRLLANEVTPKATIPQLLLIANSGNLNVSLPFLAYIRRCLLEGATIWIIGNRFPPEFLDFQLDPGQRIERISANQFKDRLWALIPPKADD